MKGPNSRSEASLASLRSRAPLATAVIYVGLSLAWILLSDPIMLRLVDSKSLVTASIIKGAAWVTVSGLILYLLVFRHVRRLGELEHEARARLIEGEKAGGFGTVEWGAGDDALHWSTGMYRLFGIEPGASDPSLPTMLGLIAPEDRNRFREALFAAATGKAIEPFDLQIRAADGAEKTLRAHWILREDRVFAALQDISSLRSAEHEALQSAAILQATLEATADGVMVFSYDGRVLISNRRFRDIFGLDDDLIRTAPALLAHVLPQVRNPERFAAWIDELKREPEIACFDLVELVDGRIFERYTAPVYLGGAPSARIASYRDATDRIRAHEQLQSRERHLAVSQEIAQIGSFEWDLEAGTMEWSDGMFMIYGIPQVAGPLPYDFGNEFRHPGDRDLLLRALARVSDGEKEGSVRFRILKPGGELRWIEARAEILERDNRRILFGVVRDVTERHQAREAVREAEERFRATFEQAAVGIAHLSPAGTFIRFNERFTTILQRDREEIEQKQLQDLVWKEDLEDAETTLALVARGEVRSLSRELRLIRAHGWPVWVELTATAVDSGDDSRYLLAVFQDISGRKKIEGERLELIRNVRLLLESTSAGLFTVDRSGICTLINQAACSMLGYADHDLVGRRIHDLIHVHPPATAEETARCPIGAGSVPESETRVYNVTFRKGGGGSLPCDVIVSPIMERGATIGAAVSFVDISERRLLESQLERSDRLASLGRLAATIAHEMNNVMMGILPFAELVSRTSDTSVARAGEQIRQSVQRGKRITQEILRFTRPAEPSSQPLELESWLNRVSGELEAIAHQSAMWKLTTPGRPLWVTADPDQLGQVLTNLTANSVDAIASGDKGGLIELALETTPGGTTFPFGHVPARHAEYAHITLRDSGKGMEPDVVQHAFEPFFTTKRKGTGLGLAIAHKLLSAQGGLLFVESALGEGTAFHAFLPRIEPPPENAAPLPTAGQNSPAGIYRILLVEDDPTVAAGIVASLEFEGSVVELVGTGRGALEALERSTPDAVILDVGLPDMDGAEVCRRIAERWPSLPVLFSTGHGDASRLEDLLAVSHRSFLMKPYSLEELHAALNRIISTNDG